MSEVSSNNKNRKIRTGVVFSNKMNKSAVVKVSIRVPHKEFKKVVTRTKKYHVHDEQNQLSIGDLVKIGEVRPISKLKRWELIEVLEKAVR